MSLFTIIYFDSFIFLLPLLWVDHTCGSRAFDKSNKFYYLSWSNCNPSFLWLHLFRWNIMLDKFNLYFNSLFIALIVERFLRCGTWAKLWPSRTCTPQDTYSAEPLLSSPFCSLLCELIQTFIHMCCTVLIYCKWSAVNIFLQYLWSNSAIDNFRLSTQ